VLTTVDDNVTTEALVVPGIVETTGGEVMTPVDGPPVDGTVVLIEVPDDVAVESVKMELVLDGVTVPAVFNDDGV